VAFLCSFINRTAQQGVSFYILGRSHTRTPKSVTKEWRGCWRSHDADLQAGETLCTPPIRGRRFSCSQVGEERILWIMPCVQSGQNPGRHNCTHNACLESQPGAAAMTVTHIPCSNPHCFSHLSIAVYTVYSTCSPMRSRPTNKKEMPWNRRK